MTAGHLVGPHSVEWAEALARVPHDTFHLPGYAVVDAQHLGGSAVAYVHCEGSRVLLVPLILRTLPQGGYRDAVSPYGYAGPTSNVSDPEFWRSALEGLRSTLVQESAIAVLLRLHPLLPSSTEALEGFGTVVRHGETVSIDLTQSPEQITLDLRSNHRRDIRRALALGQVPVVDGWEYAEEFLSMYEETMDRVGAADTYRFGERYLDELRRQLGSSLHLVTILSDATPVAAGLFFETRGLVSYHLGASRTWAMPGRPSKLLIDYTWRWAKDRGDTTLHLGGGLHGASDNSLFLFKAGFSKSRHPYLTVRTVLDPVVYDRLSQAALDGTEDPQADGYFPAYRGREAGVSGRAASSL